MKLIIEIPEEIVKAIQNGKDYRYDIHTAIAQGTPVLTDGDLISGRQTIARLIDANKLEDRKMFPVTDNYSLGWNNAIDAIMENEPTVAPENIEKLVETVAETLPKLANSIVENLPRMIEVMNNDKV